MRSITYYVLVVVFSMFIIIRWIAIGYFGIHQEHVVLF